MDTFGAALQAAEQGVGVALGLEPLFVERVRAGALVQPFAFSHPTGGYWLVHRPADAKNPALRAFTRWVLSELAKADNTPLPSEVEGRGVTRAPRPVSCGSG